MFSRPEENMYVPIHIMSNAVCQKYQMFYCIRAHFAAREPPSGCVAHNPLHEQEGQSSRQSSISQLNAYCMQPFVLCKGFSTYQKLKIYNYLYLIWALRRTGRDTVVFTMRQVGNLFKWISCWLRASFIFS